MSFAWQAQYKRHLHQRSWEVRARLEHHIIILAKMIWHDRCGTSYDLASLFRGGRSTLETWRGQITKRIGTRPSALHPIFHL